MPHNFELYSARILDYSLAGQQQEEFSTCPGTATETAEKHLRFADRRGADTLILFGAADGRLAEALVKKKHADQELVICDLYPEQIRQLNLSGFDKTLDERCAILTDSSIWAQLLLLFQNGYGATESHLILNPGLTGKSKSRHQNLQKLFSGTKNIEIPNKGESSTISAAAILSPDEPELEKFISCFPDWIEEIVLVWDCRESESIPELRKFHNAEIINIRHPLNADFSAQRNCMLTHCSGDWIIYLDADERLDNENWEIVRRAAASSECKSWYLPRMTFYPDKDHCRVGYGLWPDLQLRLFKNNDKIKFVNKIHEQLTGLEGSTGILPDCPIKHLTHLLKSREKIELKLKNFDQSTDGRFNHHLGTEYPHILNDFISPRKGCEVGPLLLPDINMS
ncbi:glycosyltransferase [Maridesulfovibrio sp.]|uniref:glycosyltransferase n=1 Tax=Maridesulfovibrio sp. TaxID=2795000 RepID=UPI002AA6E4E2|nr:glycosyltransferase [Maridesulfovibrio sp.]